MEEQGYTGTSRCLRLAILAAILLVLLGLPTALTLWLTSVPGRSFAGPLPPLSKAETALASQLRHDVAALASEPHNVAHPEALDRAARTIEARLASLGYPILTQNFDQAGGAPVRNIEIVVEPAVPAAATLVVGAHYDSASLAPGANDNASGVAALLELARGLAPLRHRSALRLRFVFFVNEEPPFFATDRMGSAVHARRLAASGENVEGMISLETLGYFNDAEGSQHYPPPLGLLYPSRGDFIAFVATPGSHSFLRKTIADFRAHAAFPSAGGTAPGFLSGIDWSDHRSFAAQGIPALMVTDTAPFRYPYYHTVQDTPEKLDYDRLARVTLALERLLLDWAEPR